MQVAATRPGVLLALVYAGIVGLHLRAWLMFLPSGVLEFAIIVATFFGVSKLLTGSAVRAVAFLGVGLAFAWWVPQGLPCGAKQWLLCGAQPRRAGSLLPHTCPRRP